MTTTINHSTIAYRHIDLLIDNSLDELHDRARDDIATAIEPHLESYRLMMRSLHDTICTDSHLTHDIDDDTDIDELAYELDNMTTAQCLTAIIDSIHATLYHTEFNTD